MNLIKRLFDHEYKELKKFTDIADKIDALNEDMQQLTDTELTAKTEEFRNRLKDGQTLDDILVEAFAVAREAAFRVIGEKHFYVQILGGLAIHFGNIAEMRTGEGKTLTSVLPAYLNALSGEGVHIITVNEYLAGRDAGWPSTGIVHRGKTDHGARGVRARPAARPLSGCAVDPGPDRTRAAARAVP